MDIKHVSVLKEGVRVAVYMGEAVSDIYGTPPIITTATVLGPTDDTEERFWLNVDIAQGQTLPQNYRVSEILGVMMPLATVVTSADGQTIEGRFTQEQMRESGYDV